MSREAKRGSVLRESGGEPSYAAITATEGVLRLPSKAKPRGFFVPVARVSTNWYVVFGKEKETFRLFSACGSSGRWSFQQAQGSDRRNWQVLQIIDAV
jgi:hypothetical protein